jgi:hypothetical protein
LGDHEARACTGCARDNFEFDRSLSGHDVGARLERILAAVARRLVENGCRVVVPVLIGSAEGDNGIRRLLMCNASTVLQVAAAQVPE